MAKTAISANTFVVTRASLKNGAPKVDRIEAAQVKTRLKRRRENTFMACFLDLDGRYPNEVRVRALGTILPAISLLLFHEYSAISEQIREDFEEKASAQDLEYLESLPDLESGLHFVITRILEDVRKQAEVVGPEEAIMPHQELFTALRHLYFELPVVFLDTFAKALES